MTRHLTRYDFDIIKSTQVLVKHRQVLYLFVIVALLLATAAIRTVNLNADPVRWYTDDLGYRIDEGYKTLSARNLYLYGEASWNLKDVYNGWINESPVTQWPYYWAFKSLGLKLSSARAVSIIFTSIFLTITAVFLWRRVSPYLVVIGLLLLAADPALFLFSRSALFETALTLSTYTGIFLAVSVPPRYKYLSPAILMCIAVLAMFYIKQSAILYMAPPILCLTLIALKDRIDLTLNRVRYTLFVIALVSIIIFIMYNPSVISMMNLSAIISRPQVLLLNPIHTLSPVALILAYTVLLELLITQPKAILGDSYRLCLASIVVVTPIALSLFIYNYTRYYLPVVPAALLLVLERFTPDITHNSTVRFKWLSLNSLLATTVFLALTMSLWASINYYVLDNLPINIGEDPGLSQPALLRTYPLFLVVFAFFTIIIARQYWNVARYHIYASLAGLHIILGLGISITALAYPGYQSHHIRNLIVQQVKQDESIGGDWAPFFVVETGLRVLYMRPDYSNAELIVELRPDYFLNSDSLYDRKTTTILENISSIVLGEPIKLGMYAGHNISLRSIRYLKQPEKNNSNTNGIKLSPSDTSVMR